MKKEKRDTEKNEKQKDNTKELNVLLERIQSIFFLVCIFMCFFLIILDYGIDHISGQKVHVTWDGSEDYPKEENDEAETINSNSLSIIEDKIKNIEGLIENRAKAPFYIQLPAIHVKKMTDKIMGLDVTVSIASGKNSKDSIDDIVLESDGMLYYALDDIPLDEGVFRLAEFNQEMKEQDRNVIYTVLPIKGEENEVYGMYYYKKYEELLQKLNENNIDYLNLQEEMIKQDIDWQEAFFATDHHWKPQMGLWANALLCQKLNDEYNYDIDTEIYDLNNYTIISSDKKWIGSLGKKATSVYCEEEEFPYISSKFKTDLTVYNSYYDSRFTGSLEEVLYDKVNSSNTFAMYGWGGQALISIHNNAIVGGPRILLIKTSFADCMYPFLATTCENVDAIDPRYFKGSLKKYIEETDPDVILFVYGLSSFYSEEIPVQFDFG